MICIFFAIILKKVFNYIKILIIVCLYLSLSVSISVPRMTFRFLIDLSPSVRRLGQLFSLIIFYELALLYKSLRSYVLTRYIHVT